jgi:ribosomal-protein-alanine N-acetyltransferase
VRPATSDDVPSLLRIEQQSDTAAHWNPRAYAALFADEAPIRKTLVVTADTPSEEIRGFLIARSIGDEWEIENLVVAPEQRRQGIGAELLGVLLRELQAAGAQAVLLEVRESNAGARRLYERYGFILKGSRPRYYENPAETALLLRRTLQLCDNVLEAE